MLGQDFAMLNYYHLIYSNKMYNYEYYENNDIEKKENWVFYFRKLLNNSLSKRFLSSCEIDNNMVCPITLDKITFPVKTPCGHIFEKENIIEWIKEKRTCPVCRNNFY
jgi:hypothetical protein